MLFRYYSNAGWSSLVARRAHNPEVVGSNPTPATMGALRLNLEAPFLLSVTSLVLTAPFLVYCRTIVPVRSFTNNYEQITVNRPFHGECSFPFCFSGSVRVNLRCHVDRCVAQQLLCKF
jgi:hypothetical protein